MYKLLHMDVPFYDFRLASGEMRYLWREVTTKVVESGSFLQSHWNSTYSEDFQRKIGRRFALGVSNGLDGLILSLRSLNLTAGKKVAVPTHTFIAVWNAVLAVGAIPVPIRVDGYGQMVVDEVLEAHSSSTIDAVIFVHMHGFPTSLKHFREWCDTNGVTLLEDCSQSHFANTADGLVGTFGHLAVFSHYPSKNLPAFGDAGTIVCDEENIFDSLVSLANYGSDKSNKYIHDRLGYNCRMDSMQAAILSLNLHYVDEWNKTRIQLAEIYRQNLEELPIRLLHDSKSGSVFHHFCILVEQRSQLIDYLSQRGIQTAIHYPIPPYREVMKWGEFKQEHQFRCESAERISSSILSLPISQWHTPEMIRFVGLTVREFYHVT